MTDLQLLPYTLLSLPRYAQIMGINPAHFMSASAESLTPKVFPITTCGQVWPKFPWQNPDLASHEELAYAILSAENDIAEAIGYFPAPRYIAGEERKYVEYFDGQYYAWGKNIKQQYKTIRTKYGRHICTGYRSYASLGTATTADHSLEYLDTDSDGFYETARITLGGVNSAYTNPSRVKVYIQGWNTIDEAEIRPIASMTLAPPALVIDINSWLMIEPELLNAFPTDDDYRAIDISDTTNFVTSVSISYMLFDDASLGGFSPPVQFSWDNGITWCSECSGSGCPQCAPVTQSGCARAIDQKLGMIAPVPAVWSATNSRWEYTTWENGIEPDRVKVWYYSGDVSNEFTAGSTGFNYTQRMIDPLSSQWAQLIAWMATARLGRPLCGCTNVETLAEYLSADLARSEQGTTFFSPVEILRNPFGTRRGEVMAWRRISKLVERNPHYAVI